MKLGEKLSLVIRQKGMTVNQVALEANVPPSSLYSIIQRNSTKVDIDAFIRICKVLNCRPEDFSMEIMSASNENNLPILTTNETRLIDYFRKFNEEGQEKLLDTASDMAQLNRYKKEKSKSNMAKTIYRAARSQDNAEHEIIEDTNGTIDKLKQIPTVTDKEDF